MEGIYIPLGEYAMNMVASQSSHLNLTHICPFRIRALCKDQKFFAQSFLQRAGTHKADPCHYAMSGGKGE